MTIQNGSKVSIHYTLTDDSGQIIDSSLNGEPLVYTAGAGEIIVGLDSALLGKNVGDNLNVRIAPAEAYGERHEEAIQVIEKSQLAHLPDLEEGMPLHAETENGVVSFIISEIGEDTITLDGNHPLAGVTLNFEVQIVSVVNQPNRIKIDV